MSGFTAVSLNGKPLIQSMTTDLETVEGNLYFPETGFVDRTKFTESDTHTHCGWKGDASYYNFKDADGKEYKDIAWYYPTPMKGAEKVAGRVAFNVRKYSELKIGEPAREELEDKAFKLGDKP